MGKDNILIFCTILAECDEVGGGRRKLTRRTWGGRQYLHSGRRRTYEFLVYLQEKQFLNDLYCCQDV